MQFNTDPCPCPIEKPEYFEVRGKCFYTDNTTRNFDDSQVHCKEIFPHGGRLFEPRDVSTKEIVKAYKRYNNDSVPSAWIGITDRSSQGNYRYESDNGQLTVSQWRSGQPNDDNDHCVILCNGSNGEWCDYACSESENSANYQFIASYPFCERTY